MGLVKCPYCGVECRDSRLEGHVCRVHPDRMGSWLRVRGLYEPDSKGQVCDFCGVTVLKDMERHIRRCHPDERREDVLRKCAEKMIREFIFVGHRMPVSELMRLYGTSGKALEDARVLANYNLRRERGTYIRSFCGVFTLVEADREEKEPERELPHPVYAPERSVEYAVESCMFCGKPVAKGCVFSHVLHDAESCGTPFEVNEGRLRCGCGVTLSRGASDEAVLYHASGRCSEEKPALKG